MTRRVLAIVGPTASGKTDIALALAERIEAEIVSADSRQVYRHLDVGTAKPTDAERARVPHHVLDVADPDEIFDAARFRAAAHGGGGRCRTARAAGDRLRRHGSLPSRLPARPVSGTAPCAGVARPPARPGGARTGSPASSPGPGRSGGRRASAPARPAARRPRPRGRGAHRPSDQHLAGRASVRRGRDRGAGPRLPAAGGRARRRASRRAATRCSRADCSTRSVGSGAAATDRTFRRCRASGIASSARTCAAPATCRRRGRRSRVPPVVSRSGSAPGSAAEPAIEWFHPEREREVMLARGGEWLERAWRSPISISSCRSPR